MSMQMTNADAVREHRQQLELAITKLFEEFQKNTGFLIASMDVKLQRIPQVPNYNNYEFRTALG